MKIFELISEQTPIGTTGSTTGMTQPVSQVKPVSQTPNADNKEQKPDAQTQQLAALLKQNNVISNDKEMNDFMGAFDASAQNKTLNPAQSEILSKLTGPMMKDPNLIAKLKMLTTRKPGDTNKQPPPPGQQMGQEPQQ